jgi:hypothetical protein
MKEVVINALREAKDYMGENDSVSLEIESYPSEDNF